MATDSGSAPASPSPPPASPKPEEHPSVPARPPWLRYGTTLLVALLAIAIIATITYSWNSWDGGRAEQVTDDAFIRGDVTPLSTRVPGIVRDVKVSDYSQVRKGDILAELENDDYQAQVAQATAAVEAANAALEDNRRQRELQDTRIERALAGVDQAKAQIAAANAGKDAVEADIVRTRAQRTRQETLLEAHATTQQNVESAVADERRFAAQAASRDADLAEAQTALRSSELAVEAERRAKNVLESQETQLIADLHAKQAGLTIAQVNLGYTKISAPADGSVGERQVRPGQLVSPGTIVIAFISTDKWVEANYRETQLTNMQPGDPAEIRIDEFPGRTIHGKVVEIAPASGSQFALLPPDNATGNYTKVVQRIPVKILLDDSKFANSLRPGLSVTASVRIRQ
jgi:membrane fusion protein, multidrug efflux system